nr:hypothetical protein CFP56_23480 [Quercus suber]
MDVKGFGKKDTQWLSGASSITGTSSSSEHQRTVSLKPVSDSTVGTTTGAEPTSKEEAITLDDNKLPVVAKVINEACVTSNSLNSTAYVSGSKENLCMSSNSLNSTAYVTGSKDNLSALRSLGSSGTVASIVIMDPPHVALKVDHQNLFSSEIQSNQLSNDYPN